MSYLPSPANSDLLKLALARAALVSGLGVLGAAMLQTLMPLPTFPAFGVGGFIGGVLFFQDVSHIFAALEKVWKAQQQAREKQLHFEASLFGGGWEPQAEWAEAAAASPPSEAAARVLIGHPNGAYTQPPLSQAEQEELALIGDGLRFLAIASRAEGLSLRVMQTCRPPQFTEAQFETWWKRQTDQLAYWGIVDKADRQATRYAARYPTLQAARRALTHREFRRHPTPPRATDRQTDSQTAQTDGRGGGIMQAATQ